jgi:L-fuconolactonase
MNRIDAHVHLWDPERGDYGWLGPHLPELNRRFSCTDLQPMLLVENVDGVVLVQAAPTAQETDYLLAIAVEIQWIFGVVGWIDLDSADAENEIGRRSAQLKFRGIRPMLQDLSDREWILRAVRADALAAVESSGLVFDALIRPPHLPVISKLALRYPGLSIIIDHGAKPAVRPLMDPSWRSALQEIARYPNVCCKLSGLLTELVAGTGAEMIPFYVQELLAAFGSERLIWGSDWPVLTRAASYEQWMQISRRCLDSLSSHQQDLIMGGNATRLYGLGRA